MDDASNGVDGTISMRNSQVPGGQSSVPADGDGSKTGADRKSKAETTKTALEVAAKLILGVAGFCYVLGLIVVPLHLSQYGVNTLDLPQVSYVKAGMWAVLPIVLVIVSILFAIYLVSSVWQDKRQKHWMNKWGDLVVVVLSVPFIMFLTFGFLINRLGIDFSWKNWFWFPLIGTGAGLLTLAAIGRLTRLTKDDGLIEFSNTLGVLVVGVVLFLIYVILFSQATYNSIPWSAGGGRASHVRLYVPVESKACLEGLKIALAPEQSQKEVVETDAVQLLLTTDKQMVIVNSEKKAVSVPAEAIRWVRYDK